MRITNMHALLLNGSQIDLNNQENINKTSEGFANHKCTLNPNQELVLSPKHEWGNVHSSWGHGHASLASKWDTSSMSRFCVLEMHLKDI